MMFLLFLYKIKKTTTITWIWCRNHRRWRESISSVFKWCWIFF